MPPGSSPSWLALSRWRKSSTAWAGIYPLCRADNHGHRPYSLLTRVNLRRRPRCFPGRGEGGLPAPTTAKAWAAGGTSVIGLFASPTIVGTSGAFPAAAVFLVLFLEASASAVPVL